VTPPLDASWLDAAWEFARAVYSLGLLGLGGVVVVGAPAVVKVLRELTKALTATAKSLSAVVADKEALEQIKTSVERLEVGREDDRRAIAEIKELLGRLLAEKTEKTGKTGKTGKE
jgi:hypothetical protein